MTPEEWDVLESLIKTLMKERRALQRQHRACRVVDDRFKEIADALRVNKGATGALILLSRKLAKLQAPEEKDNPESYIDDEPSGGPP